MYGSHTGGISTWPDLVQYLLTIYATPGDLCEAVVAVRTISQ